MFDYYALPDDWPGRVDASAMAWHNRASHVENMIHEEIIKAVGGNFDPKYFIPYVQLHEFEALAFSDVEILASVLSPIAKRSLEFLTEKFTGIVNEAGDPEAIDDGYETCPSRRISKIVPAYKKRAQGPIITSRIGIEALRNQCSHFGRWLTCLEQLDVQSR